MPQFTTLRSHAVLLGVDDVDTDQIIPARFLKVTDKSGLGANLFADWRYAADGSPKSDFPLNRESAKGASILVAGRNFGCGSSREHAPWALAGFGFRAVVATSFADIFKNNALKNGLLPVAVDAEAHAAIVAQIGRDPVAPFTIELDAQQLTLPDGRALGFPVEPFAKSCLLNGVDELGYILRFEQEIAAFERRTGRVTA